MNSSWTKNYFTSNKSSNINLATPVLPTWYMPELFTSYRYTSCPTYGLVYCTLKRKLGKI